MLNSFAAFATRLAESAWPLICSSAPWRPAVARHHLCVAVNPAVADRLFRPAGANRT